ncbi:hypothetical protein SAMN02745945_00157 [Peptoclostridium litorale DSM 5388]|uniref:Uncharacterized protein n=1 Tax=Peptoclostridium litorale DSM 5388 TaxID=1121324 RepID=A0A069RKF9_PEPLI|nr:hypothetical protein [Peptoclostridium litorale]KDR96595.1 hypothetical protein CLIT_2c02010 [Peptoclostridium litorale DSM 5388]SIN68690.1 hypothetical protein SAMN02745945_00157 [Peptoclostridium litorale DSM 5388]
MKITFEIGNKKEVEAFFNNKEIKGKAVIIDGRLVIERWGEVLINEIEGTNGEFSMNFTPPGEMYEEKLNLKYEIPFWVYFNLNKEKADIIYQEEANQVEIRTVAK